MFMCIPLSIQIIMNSDNIGNLLFLAKSNLVINDEFYWASTILRNFKFCSKYLDVKQLLKYIYF